MKEQMNINNWNSCENKIRLIFMVSFIFLSIFYVFERQFLSVIVSSWLECILCGVFGADNPTFPDNPSTLDGLLFRIGAMVAIGVVSKVVKDWRLWLYWFNNWYEAYKLNWNMPWYIINGNCPLRRLTVIKPTLDQIQD